MIKKVVRYYWNLSLMKVLPMFDMSSNKKHFKCNICNKESRFMLPKGDGYLKLSSHNIISARHRAHAYCIYCCSYDRERFIYYILNKYTDLFKDKTKVLHIAPEKNISNCIKKLKNKYTYISGDIRKGKADMLLM